MRTTIDRAGRIVIPKLCATSSACARAVAVTADGAGLRIQPVASDEVAEEGDRPVIPPAAPCSRRHSSGL